MGAPLAPLITDVADTAIDVARVSGDRGVMAEAAEALQEKRDELKAEQTAMAAQIAEIERFHEQVTGQPMKEAAIRALTWHKM
jgi:hypothetical protein